MRAVRWILLAFVTLLVLGVAGVLALGTHPAGFVWLVEQAEPRVPGTLHIDKPGGDLLRGVSAERLEYRLDTLEVEATAVELKLRWATLAAGLVRLSRLKAETLRITLLPAEEPATEPIVLPEVNLPLALQIGRGRIGSLQLQVGELDETVQDLRLRATLRGSRLRIDQLEGQLRELKAGINGRLQMRGDWPLEASLEWQLLPAPAGLGEVGGSLSARGSLAQLELQQSVRVPDIADTLRMRATVSEPLAALQLDAQADWTGLQWPPASGAAATLRSPSGSVSFSGIPEAYRLELDVDVATPEAVVALLPEQPADALAVTASASGDLSQLRIDALRVSGLAEVITGSGTLQWQGEVVRGQALQLAAGANQLDVDGLLWPEFNLAWILQVPSLGAVLPQAGGALLASGELSGTADSPAGRLQLEGSELRFDDFSVGTVRGEAAVTADGRFTAQLAAGTLGLAAFTAAALNLDISGTLEGHDFALDWNGAPLDGRLRGRGRQTADGWSARIAAAELSQPLAGDWQLQAPLELALTLPQDGRNFRAALGAQCWLSAPAQLCAGPARIDDSLALSAELRDLPLERLAMLQSEAVVVTGTAQAELQLAGTVTNPSATARVELEQAVLARPGARPGELAAATGLPEARAELSLDNSQLAYRAAVTGERNLQLRLTGSSVWPLATDTPLAAQLTASLDDFSSIAPLLLRFGGIEPSAGRLRAEFAIDGTVAAPSMSGSGRLTELRVRVPAAGIELTDVQAEVRGRNGEALQLTASLASGGGQAQLEGELELLPAEGAAGPRASFTLTGDSLQVLRFPEQEVFASPKLQASYAEGELRVGGRVQVPRAFIKVRELPQTAVRPSPDTVVIRSNVDEDTSAAQALRLRARVNVELGDDVRFEAFGLGTRLTGALTLATTPANPQPTAEGNLRSVDGRFEAFGQKLDIERGTLVFTGALDRPFVDVRAARSLRYNDQPVKAGVLVTGPIDAMQTRVFGEPAMSESDALSYLLVGRPMQRTDSINDEQFSSAAVALGLVNLLPQTQRLGSSLGLDEVGFEGTTESTSAVVAGKRIGKDFYVRYAYGLFDRIGTFIVRYNLGRGLSLEAGYGEEQTINLLYSVDR